MWQHAAPGTETRLRELAEPFATSRAAFFDIAQDENHWLPNLESLAQRDLMNGEVGPNGPWGELPVHRNLALSHRQPVSRGETPWWSRFQHPRRDCQGPVPGRQFDSGTWVTLR